jgi:hypothetical protein
MSARELCLKVKQYKGLIKANLGDIIKNSTSETEIIDKILSILGLSDSDKAKFKETVVIEQGKVCTNTSDLTQLNVFDSTECAKIFGCIRRSNYNNNRTNFYNQMKGMGYTDDQALKELSYLDAVCTFEGEQENKANIIQSCLMNNIANSIDKTTYNPVALAIYETIIENNDETKEFDCNVIPLSAGLDSYTKILDACINHVGLTQKNIAICTSNFKQSNIANIYQECKINIAPKEEPAPVPQPVPQPVPKEEPKEQPKEEVKPDVAQVPIKDNTLYYAIGLIVICIVVMILFKILF